MKDLNTWYNNLWKKADNFVKKVNPCKIENGKCLRAQKGGRNFCCGEYCGMSVCPHLGESGCQAKKPLGCRLWLCEDAIEDLTKKERLRLYNLEKEFNELYRECGCPEYIRKDKDEFLKGVEK